LKKCGTGYQPVKNTGKIAGATLPNGVFQRAATAGYQRVLMNSGGAGTYAVVLPIVAASGQRLAYYVAATSANTYQSQTCFLVRTEWAPLWLEYSFGATGVMRITEWMYSRASGEFIEFTNMSHTAIDMTGWSFDDDHVTAGAFDLSAFGLVQPGESVVITESAAETFRTAWGLAPTVKIIGDLGVITGHNLAPQRRDQSL
jgi:hypothetical protein